MLYWLTKTIASMGATNVQMAFVPFPEDNQQLDLKYGRRENEVLAPELKENNANLQTVSLSKLQNYSETQEGTVGILTALCPKLNPLLHIHKEY